MAATTERKIGCKIEKHCSLQNSLHGEGSERRPFIFIFRLNIVLHASNQVDEIVIEIEEWKQKVPGNYVKRFSRALLSLLKTSILSSRNSII